MFGETDVDTILSEARPVTKAHPNNHVRLIGYRQLCQSQGTSMVIYRGPMKGLNRSGAALNRVKPPTVWHGQGFFFERKNRQGVRTVFSVDMCLPRRDAIEIDLLPSPISVTLSQETTL